MFTLYVEHKSIIQQLENTCANHENILAFNGRRDLYRIHSLKREGNFQVIPRSSKGSPQEYKPSHMNIFRLHVYSRGQYFSRMFKFTLISKIYYVSNQENSTYFINPVLTIYFKFLLLWNTVVANTFVACSNLH
mgnify:CR=1 FL=1